MIRKAVLVAEICALREVGRQMANACYNMSQKASLQADREVLQDLVREYDAIPRSQAGEPKTVASKSAVGR